MCGIVGYVGYRPASPLLLEGLDLLDYRGYDSAGIAVQNAGKIYVRKCAGRIQELSRLIDQKPIEGTIGIGHTRWATHGGVTDDNSHPHTGGGGEVVLVHNGIIENHAALHSWLESCGYQFRTNTDTEVIAHLLAHHLNEQVQAGAESVSAPICMRAIRLSLAQLIGTYGLAILFRDCPDTLFAVGTGCPLIVGVGQGEHLVASDACALARHTRQVVYLSNHQLAVLTPDHLQVQGCHHTEELPSVRNLEEVSREPSWMASATTC